jgi:hypothetical protein
MKSTTQLRILALEPDRARAENLRRFIADRVDAEVTIATSSHVAITLVSQRVPDVVLTSALAPPAEDERLVAHLRQIDGTSDLPILTVPPVTTSEREPRDKGGLFGFLQRRRAPLPTYDPDFVSARIAEAVESARVRRRRREKQAAFDRSLAATVRETPAPAPPAPEVPSVSLVLARPSRELKDRARRLSPTDIPWLGGVQTQSGVRLDVLNISSTGVLVESAAKFMPDSFSELHLVGSGKTLVVPARFVRSEVAQVNRLGVRYQSAAVFDHAIDLVLDRGVYRQASKAATPEALAELLMRVTAHAGVGRSEEARTLFEEGLRELVPAREIQIRTAPALRPDCESVYFTVPTGNNQPPVLQVTFEPNYRPAHEELSLLKAAASVAAVVLQCGKSFSAPVVCNAW